ncbi:MAG TPA: thiamine pyrophosphate-dependent enzyme, partial [Gammaproteobacteria bacterium]|nr:thiamine pyrophosphate-dependent enzyme [Gammaproteobacteria bacterium]
PSTAEEIPAQSRRSFLKGAAAGTAAIVAVRPATTLAQTVPPRGPAQTAAPEPPVSTRTPAPPLPGRAIPLPTEAAAAAEAGGTPPPLPSIIVEHPQADFMIDVLKSLGLEYVAANPGSSFDGLQESIINYGGNTGPEFLTCCHEESSVAMAHGYAKIEGKPMAAFVHGTVGLMHASMAIYNAYGDRAPVYIVAGLGRNAVRAHAATDMAAIVRDFVKWDHQPISLDDFAETAVQAYRLSSTPPTGPVLLVVDLEMQLAALPSRPPRLRPVTLPQPPAADIGSLREIAQALVTAENPQIVCGRAARTQKGIDLLVELAELLQAPVDGGNDRVNFPSRHPLAGRANGEPDVIVNLETGGRPAPGARQLTISSAELLVTSTFEISPPLARGDLVAAADAEASLPGLIEEVRRRLTPAQRRRFAARGARLAAFHQAQRLRALDRARIGWDGAPISIPRLCAELWHLIEHEDWSLVSPQGFLSGWPGLLWNMDKHYRYIGAQGAGGMGYGAPASVGAALANRRHGRVSVNIQTDGDLCYGPAVLWTAAHHRIPLLTVMHNNRAYHQEVMFMQRVSTWHNRGADRARIGTTLTQPNIDYARMAESFGVYGEGPITEPSKLGPALARGLERVKRGEPALIDVVTQPR